MCSYFFLFKQKTPYEMRISDWSSDVCSSDLGRADLLRRIDAEKARADAAEKYRRELEALVQERGVADAISFATKHTALAERIKALEEELLSATAHLVAAASAYKEQIGSASWRERACQYVWISVGAVSLKKKK